MSITPIVRFADTDWHAAAPAQAPAAPANEAVLESGAVLCFPQLRFALLPDEERFLDTRWADGKAKNISLRGREALLRGAAGAPEDQAALRAMVMRFRDQANALIDRLLPHYRGHLELANTSYRPMAITGRATSWRKDDTRLHVDAFPSNPTRGTRLLRVFTNLNPTGQPRAWRVGEDFETFARRHVGAIARPLPGSAWLLNALHITKRLRSEYDHLMLQLHDRAKADLAWQKDSPQAAVDFAPGTTWVVYSDQVLHAAMAGQFMMEQTFNLRVEHQLQPETAPLKVLERLTGRALLA